MNNASSFNTVSVIGLGYIGLPTAAMFASRRTRVIGVDCNAKVVEMINRGQIHIVEPELDIVVHGVVSEGYLRATTKPEPADAFLIAVPTPFKEGFAPDLAFVECAARSIAPVLKRGDLVILESTSPVGTTEQVSAWLAECRPDLRFPKWGTDGPADVCVAYCPERVLPGQVVHELVSNDRVIGGLTAQCAKRAVELYRIFVQGDLHVSDARTAEMCKLSENSFRDVNIAFANELSTICHQLGIDVWRLIELANRHPRVKILQPGAGVGGHCIAVDPWFIVSSAPEQAHLICTARQVNDAKPQWVVERVMEAVAAAEAARRATESDLTVAVLGLSFKPNIDDLRESPALHIAESLSQQLRGRMVAVEPNISELSGQLAGVELLELQDALECADVIVALVAHREFDGLKAFVKPGQFLVDAVGLCR
ncbi:MAG TPA: UDP-N-acetyl-D-mannosamine dehydrogenase [Burkholderiaceae bacterium]|nr:UDP-N-acetyl-D-mannosamine dehydrogenase [Burkholderiaceae bacterium]